MKKAIKLFESIEPTFWQIDKECKKYLKRLLKRAENHCIKFYDEDDEPIHGEFVSVIYDGGNHPEFASNAFSIVYDVHLGNDGDVCLRVDDDEDYGIERLTWEEVYSVAKFVYNILKH